MGRKRTLDVVISDVCLPVEGECPQLARSGLKAGFADGGVRRVRLVRRKLQIADHTERIVGRRLVRLSVTDFVVSLCFFNGSPRGVSAAFFVGEPGHFLRPINCRQNV